MESTFRTKVRTVCPNEGFDRIGRVVGGICRGRGVAFYDCRKRRVKYGMGRGPEFAFMSSSIVRRGVMIYVRPRVCAKGLKGAKMELRHVLRMATGKTITLGGFP